MTSLGHESSPPSPNGAEPTQYFCILESFSSSCSSQQLYLCLLLLVDSTPVDKILPARQLASATSSFRLGPTDYGPTDHGKY